MIDTLIFDLGNVIVDFIPLSIYEKATGSTSDGQLLYDLFMSSGIWHELDRGIPLEQVITLTSQKAPQHLHEAIAYVVHNSAGRFKQAARARRLHRPRHGRRKPLSLPRLWRQAA